MRSKPDSSKQVLFIERLPLTSGSISLLAWKAKCAKNVSYRL